MSVVDARETQISINKPTVAVLVATQNRPGLLARRSLTAIQRQVHRPDYVVVVDDSDDPHRADNRNIVNDLRMGDTKIVYLDNVRTQGASGAWNTGLERLRRFVADPSLLFVAILDDDDEWEPEHLKVCVDAVVLHQADMVASALFRRTGDDQDHLQYPPEALVAEQFLVGNPHIQGSNLFVRLSALLEAGTFDEALSSCTDRDLCVRLCDLGWVRYVGLDHPTVRHYAEEHRPRLSSPMRHAKARGLDRFWSKWRARMTEEQRAACLQRAENYFGWVPTGPMEEHCSFDGPFVPSSAGTENVAVHCGDLAIVVGIIADGVHADQLRRLLDDLIGLRSIDRLQCMDVVVLQNGDDSDVITRLIADYRSRGMSLFLASEQQQCADINQGKFGDDFHRPEGRAPIGPARTMLQHYVTRVVRRRPGAIAWILDDDCRLSNLSDEEEAPSFTTLLKSLYHMRSLGVDVVLGSVTGDPPIPSGSTVRTQMVDLYHNLSWLMGLDPAAPLPDRRDENRAIRASAKDFYYDLSRRDTHHLESPFWLTPEHADERVDDAYFRMVELLPRMLAGQAVFRPLLLDRPFDPVSSIRPSVQRGGNTFVFDCAAFEEFPNLAPEFAGSTLRRSDMIWALLNRYAGGRRVVGAALSVRHDRADEEAVGLDLERLIPDMRGYALYSALDDVLRRRREYRLRDGIGADTPDDLRFSESDLDLAVDRFEKYVKERTAALLLNCWRVQGLCGSLLASGRNGLFFDAFFECDSRFGPSQESLKRFLTNTQRCFSLSRVSDVSKSVLAVSTDEVRSFMLRLGGMVARHRQGAVIQGNDDWFSRERVAAARAIAIQFSDRRELDVLGSGEEGVVFASGVRVIKVIDYSGRSKANGAWDGMRVLGAFADPINPLSHCELLDAPGSRKIISYPFENGRPYRGGRTSEVIQVLRDCRDAGVVCTNFHPKNLLETPDGVRLIDFGADIRPFCEAGFHSMVQRAWLTLRYSDRDDLTMLMHRALGDQSMQELEGWEVLLAAIDPPSKQELVDDAMLDFVQQLPKSTVLDFGCGHGHLAAQLARDGVDVVAFDPDRTLERRWSNYDVENGAAVEWLAGDVMGALVDRVGHFDLVVSSLVLCVIEDETEYRNAIRTIAQSLSDDGRFVILLCNPSATLTGDSTLQRRNVPPDAERDRMFIWTKQLPSGRTRTDVHRPFDQILIDLAAEGLHVECSITTGGLSLNDLLPSNDYLILSGSKTPVQVPVCVHRSSPRLSADRRPIEVPVLCYHRVLPRDFEDDVSCLQRRRGTVVDVDVFTHQMCDLVRGFTPLNQAQYLKWLDGEIELPKNACLLTFDDGYRDFLSFALPILSDFGIPAVLFPTKSAATGADLLPTDQLYAALSAALKHGEISPDDSNEWLGGERKRQYVRSSRETQMTMLADAGLGAVVTEPESLYLTEEDLLDLPKDLVAVGSHGECHEVLAGRELPDLRRELRTSRFWLEKINHQRGAEHLMIAFPNGTYDDRTIAATIECGFHAAFTVEPYRPECLAHRWTLRRSCMPNRVSAVRELAAGKEIRI